MCEKILRATKFLDIILIFLHISEKVTKFHTSTLYRPKYFKALCCKTVRTDIFIVVVIG